MNKAKKGLAWNALIPAIIALFVIGIVAYVALGPTLIGTLKEFFGLFDLPEEEFIPYEPLKLTLCEQKVTDSVNSLILGIN